MDISKDHALAKRAIKRAWGDQKQTVCLFHFREYLELDLTQSLLQSPQPKTFCWTFLFQASRSKVPGPTVLSQFNLCPLDICSTQNVAPIHFCFDPKFSCWSFVRPKIFVLILNWVNNFLAGVFICPQSPA